MAKSSISADITAANSKMAQHIRAKEEREGLGIGRKKNRDVAANERKIKTGGKGKDTRWSLPADFSSPTPMVDRPRTTTGSTSFHFSYTSVSKEGSPTLNGNPISTGSFGSASPGADHSKYIEREGAAEYSLGADHASYIERDGAVEMMDRTGEISEGMERSLADIVNETPMEDEAKMLGVEDVREGVPSIFSNISNDPFEREEYWRAVHRCEREPRKHQLLVDPSTNPAWWQQVEGWPDMNEAFRAHCLMERERYRQWQRTDSKEPSEKSFQPKPFQEDAEIIGRALMGARMTPGWNEIDPPVTFKSGRGGRVQFRFVAELPHELTPEDRALIVQNFCDHLGSFSEGPDGKPTGMMYTAVIHAPDAHNDRRNYHLHVIAHDRPAEWLADHNQWDFEVAETYNHKGEDRIRYPFRQNKIGEVARKDKDSGDAYNDAAGRDFVPAMRQRYADISNAVLGLRGIERRLDPRSYQEMGIDRTPTKHLGTKAAAMESIGVPTEIGQANANAIWSDAERAIAKRAREVDAALRKEQQDLITLASDVQKTAPRSESLKTLRILTAEREALIDAVADDRRLIMTFDHLEAKAKSRAIRTRQTCLQFLTDIQHGTADRTTSSSVKQIKQRWKEAQDHLDAIDRDLAPERPSLAAAAQDVITREDRIKQIDSLLLPIKAALDNAALQGREEREARLKRRDRAATLTERDEAEKAARDQARTIAEPTAGPVTDTPSTAAEPAVASPTTIIMNTTENNDVRPRIDAAALLRAGWIAFPSPEPGPLGSAGLSDAGDLAGVRDLSSLGLVHDDNGSAMLLSGIPSVVVEREGGGRDVLRREGDRDPAASGEGSGRRGITSPAPAQRPEIASMQPVAIEGLPIAAPTIDPAASPLATPAELAARAAIQGGPDSIPDGLVPVRQPTSASVPADPAEAATPIDGSQDRGTPQEPRQGEGAPSTSSGDQAAVEAPSEPQEPAARTDGRRKVEDATLFPLERHVAPEKPGTVRAEYSAWNDLISRISNDRSLVIRTVDARGRASFDVPSLPRSEQAILGTERFATRTVARLAAIHQSQQREIERLVRWIGKNGRNRDELAIVDRRAKIVDAPKSVHRLMKDWGIHPAVGEALRAESARRSEEAAKAETQQPTRTRTDASATPVAQDADAAARERAAELRRLLPDPSVALTAKVEDLLRLLREDADRKAIEAAAERVRQDAAAREDVHRHGIDLSQAYNTILDEAGQGFGLQTGRGKRGGR